MKTKDKSAGKSVKFEELIPEFLKTEILTVSAMQSVRGGDGDGGGDLVIIPRPPDGQN
jgi:hypothetical protein